MPAVNVARTDTFEQQRVKINEIGTDLFSVTSGGSNLATGNLRLGDGTVDAPSLNFTSDNSLGLFKPGNQSLGFVSSGKKIADIGLTANYSYQDFNIQQRKLNSSFITLVSGGQNYDGGSYTAVPLTGGTGSGATADIVVNTWEGAVTNAGSLYTPGQFLTQPISGGSGTGCTASFDVDGIVGQITNIGSGYNPSTYTDVPLTGGSGTGAEATITFNGEAEITGSVTQAGTGYTDGSYNQIQLFSNTVTQTFVVTSIANPNAGQPNEPAEIYQIDGSSQPTLSLIVGNTYRFDMSDASLQGANPGQSGSEHKLDFSYPNGSSLPDTIVDVKTSGAVGNANCFQDLIIKPNAPQGSNVIRYDCVNHPGMGPAGGNITLSAGAAGQSGAGAAADITVSGNAITAFALLNNGKGYKIGDVLTVSVVDIPGGSGFTWTVSGVTYTGTVDTVTITDEGSGYALNDVLSATDANLGGGGTGTGFEYTVTSNPGLISNFVFNDRGTGYAINDQLTLSSTIPNKSSYAPGTTTSFAATLNVASTTVTISDTSSLVAGMSVNTSVGDTGQLDQACTIQSVDSGTDLTLSIAPTVSGAANLVFSSANLVQMTIDDTTGLVIGTRVEKVSGIGVLAAGTTVANVDSATEITISASATTPGPIVVNFVPAYGDPADDWAYTIDTLGEVSTVTLVGEGNGYSKDDVLSAVATDLIQPIDYAVTFKTSQTVTFTQTIPDSAFALGDSVEVLAGNVTNITTTSTPTITTTVTGPLAASLSSATAVVSGLSDTTGISVGDAVTEDGSGNIAVNTTVASVDSATQITLSANPLQTASVNLTFTSDEAGSYTGVASTGGTGSGATFDVVRGTNGIISSVALNAGGGGYTAADAITIAGTLVGGTSPAHDITLTADTVDTATAVEIMKLTTAGGNITSMLINAEQATIFTSGDSVVKTGTASPVYTVDTASALGGRFHIDIGDGNGAQLTPDLTLFAGNKYRFDLSDASMSSHQFSLSIFPDGPNAPSLVDNVQTTLSNASRVITVASTTGIQVGMEVTKVSGTGVLASATRVESIDNATTITLNNLPDTSGLTVVKFSGIEYTDGFVRSATDATLTVTANTPTLYYFCNSGAGHEDEGGADGQEATITIDQNNPKTFGTGFQIRATEIATTDIISAKVLDGKFTAGNLVGTEAEITTLTAGTGTFTTASATTSITTPLITNPGGTLGLTATTTAVTGDLTVNGVHIINATSNVETTGELKTTNRLNVNDNLFITGATISSDAASDIVIAPAGGKIAKIDGTNALTIPAGTTLQRPSAVSVSNGSIRYNTDTNSYEGYSASSSSWGSLGGLRDLDGNTYIAAEATIGANDNTLWFYNDGNNSIKITPTHFEFFNVKKIRSANTTAPAYTDWLSQVPVSLGAYLKWKNNLYEVTTAGTTGTTGTEPTHTSGAVTNGTCVLTYHSLAVGKITFEDVEEIEVGPTGSLPLVINGELRFADNVISTDINDLIIRPNSGKRVTVDADTSLVIPAGTTAERGVAGQGSIRYNTTSLQFEGYDGSNWGSLGGIKDVDQDTYIIPELTAGGDQDTLYFHNAGANTLQLTTTSFDFYAVDTIRSMTSDEFEITASLMTFDNAAATFDNTDSTKCFLHTTKQYFDIGVSSGVYTDPILRLDSLGDVYLNTGYGTGTYSGVKVFDSDLKEFELADVRIQSDKVTLIKGSVNNGNSTIYDNTVENGAKVVIVAENTTNNSCEFIEFGVIDNGTDVFHTEYGNSRTNENLIDVTWEVTGTNKIQINLAVAQGVANAHSITTTIVSNVTKK